MIRFRRQIQSESITINSIDVTIRNYQKKIVNIQNLTQSMFIVFFIQEFEQNLSLKCECIL